VLNYITFGCEQRVKRIEMDLEMVSLLNSIAKATTAFLLVFFSLIVFFHGSLIGGIVFKEPDICFLLATGRWIVEHGQIPQQDPFSYTAHLLQGKYIFGYYFPPRYVLEKWLSEALFFEIWSYLGPLALLLFTTFLSTLTYVLLPLRILRLCGWQGLRALLLTMLILTTSWSHLAARPDVISFFLVAVWLELLVRQQKRKSSSPKSISIDLNWQALIIFALIDCLWANMHIVFLFGIILPAIYTFCLVAERLFPTLRQTPFNWTVPIGLVLCVLVTFINPWGIGLWEYIPFVFGEAVEHINEMQPLGPKNFGNLFFIGFYVLIFLSLRSLWLNGRKNLKESGDFWYRFLTPAGIAFGFKNLRSIPIGALFMLVSIAGMRRPKPFDNELLALVDQRLRKFIKPFSLSFTLFVLLMAELGTYCVTFAVPPEIPQGSAAFTPPLGAIQFIKEHRPSGNLLNDPHFGCVMEWKLKDAPAVFLDPRYNIFGAEVGQDYWNMALCKNGWQDLLKKYDIRWVFLPPKLELVKEISKDPNWHLLYADEASVIYQR
jgi:hypothetical protein